MELSSRVFVDILSPLAAFARVEEDGSSHAPDNVSRPDTKTAPSSNGRTGNGPSPSPVDSAPQPAGTWRLDGVDSDGRRLFAVPGFAVGAPPLRIDVLLPAPEDTPRALRASAAMTMGSPTSAAARGLPLSRHVVRALEHWSAGIDDAADKAGRGGQKAADKEGEFRRRYEALPFGSRIVVADVGADPTRAEIHLVPRYDVEQAMLSTDELRRLWANDSDGAAPAWPEELDWAELRFHRQLHEAISIVAIPGRRVPADGDHASPTTHTITPTHFVFKSLVRDLRYMYHELRVLLALPPHASLVRRPLFVVTRRARFGGRRGVCGFVLEYVQGGGGSLRDRLLLAEVAAGISSPAVVDEGGKESDVPLADCFRWARQVAAALAHVNEALPSGSGYYPDLKPDNVVLRARRGTGTAADADMETAHLDAVLLDLEQRGGWFSWSPPEVLAVEYAELLATRLPGGRGDTRAAEARRRAARGLNRYLACCGLEGEATFSEAADDGCGDDEAGVDDGDETETRYRGEDGGFSLPWRALLARRNLARRRDMVSCGADPVDDDDALALERAQVFMLGKLLWCMFERRARVRCGLDHELLRDDDYGGGDDGETTAMTFPTFRRTPIALRALVRACTAGAPEWEDAQEGRAAPGAARGRRRPLAMRAGRLVVVDPVWLPEGGDGKGRRWCCGDVEAVGEDESGGEPLATKPAENEVRDVARQWWADEVQSALALLDQLADGPGSLQSSGATDRNAFTAAARATLEQSLQRPRLGDVLEKLGRIEESI